MAKAKEPEVQTTAATITPEMQELMDKLAAAEARAAALEAKNTAPKTDAKAPAESAAEIGKKLDQQRIMIFLPATGVKDEDTVPVIINGIATLIPKGKRVAVTRPVYDVLMRSEDAHMQTLRFDREKENVDNTREKW